MNTYAKFKKMNIDLSTLGFELNNSDASYYCTPKGANILAWAGVDGIHYCTIPKFGEMIFAVSPMNIGDCVHPIARNFEDLLRLLLNCADMAALEQCYGWDEEQFRAFLIDCPATEKQQAALETIRKEFDLAPMENAFVYVKKLQSEFDLSQIPYTEDYYDPDMNAAAPDVSTEWKVFYEGGFWCKKGKGRAGKEITLNSCFAWDKEMWHIPSIYSCSKGLVIDFCVEIKPEYMKAFMDKWEPTRIAEEGCTREMRERLDKENPLAIDFRLYLYLNGKVLTPKSGTSISWIPESCIPEGEKNPQEAKQLIQHYGLDETRAWSFHRWSCPWSTSRKPTIKSLKLKLERHPVSIPSIHFKDPSVGDVISFVHPIFNTEYKLTVQAYEKNVMNFNRQFSAAYEYPTHMVEMAYTLSPELPPNRFSITDCRQNDAPKMIQAEQLQNVCSASAIGIIGGADGPTAIIMGVPQCEQKHHIACSALTFEPQNEVEWQITFSEKMMGDICVDLLTGF